MKNHEPLQRKKSSFITKRFQDLLRNIFRPAEYNLGHPSGLLATNSQQKASTSVKSLKKGVVAPTPSDPTCWFWTWAKSTGDNLNSQTWLCPLCQNVSTEPESHPFIPSEKSRNIIYKYAATDRKKTIICLDTHRDLFAHSTGKTHRHSSVVRAKGSAWRSMSSFTSAAHEKQKEMKGKIKLGTRKKKTTTKTRTSSSLQKGAIIVGRPGHQTMPSFSWSTASRSFQTLDFGREQLELIWIGFIRYSNEHRTRLKPKTSSSCH